MQCTILAEPAVLLFGISLQLSCNNGCLCVILVGGLIDGLIGPCGVEQAFIVLLLTDFLQLFGDTHELLTVSGADVT
jgi:hypothetical protein